MHKTPESPHKNGLTAQPCRSSHPPEDEDALGWASGIPARALRSCSWESRRQKNVNRHRMWSQFPHSRVSGTVRKLQWKFFFFWKRVYKFQRKSYFSTFVNLKKKSKCFKNKILLKKIFKIVFFKWRIHNFFFPAWKVNAMKNLLENSLFFQEKIFHFLFYYLYLLRDCYFMPHLGINFLRPHNFLFSYY